MRSFLLFLALAVLATIAAVAAFADATKLKYTPALPQQPTTPAKLDFNGIGSFRLEGAGDLTVTVDGTVLLNNVTGSIAIGPGLKKEYGPVTVDMAGKKVTRVGYHGKGTIKVTNGYYRAFHFFGKKCSGAFYGVGRLQLTGSGKYTVQGQPAGDWYEGGSTVYCPAIPPDNNSKTPSKPLDKTKP